MIRWTRRGNEVWAANGTHSYVARLKDGIWVWEVRNRLRGSIAGLGHEASLHNAKAAAERTGWYDSLANPHDYEPKESDPQVPNTCALCDYTRFVEVHK